MPGAHDISWTWRSDALREAAREAAGAPPAGRHRAGARRPRLVPLLLLVVSQGLLALLLFEVFHERRPPGTLLVLAIGAACGLARITSVHWCCRSSAHRSVAGEETEHVGQRISARPATQTQE